MKYIFTLFLFFAFVPFTAQARVTTEISNAYSYEMADQATSTAIFMDITNEGGIDRALLGASIPNSEARVEIHEMKEADGVMKMRPVKQLIIPANDTVSLSPMGYHIMVMGVEKPYKDGDIIRVILEFDGGFHPEIGIEVPVMSRASKTQKEDSAEHPENTEPEEMTHSDHHHH